MLDVSHVVVTEALAKFSKPLRLAYRYFWRNIYILILVKLHFTGLLCAIQKEFDFAGFRILKFEKTN